MPARKSYGQFCALARALDHVGERWTLLVVRELLLGPRTYRDLESALAPVSPTVLVDRLRALVDDGLVDRNDAPARSKSVTYRLTDAGLGLEPTIMGLIRWGAHWMVEGPGDDRMEPAWAALALRALLDGTVAASPVSGAVHLDIEDTSVTVRVRRGRRLVAAGRQGSAAAAAAVTMPEALALGAGLRRPRDLDVEVDGDAELFEAVFTTA